MHQLTLCLDELGLCCFQENTVRMFCIYLKEHTLNTRNNNLLQAHAYYLALLKLLLLGFTGWLLGWSLSRFGSYFLYILVRFFFPVWELNFIWTLKLQKMTSKGPFSHREYMKQKLTHNQQKLHFIITHSAWKESRGGVITHFPPSGGKWSKYAVLRIFLENIWYVEFVTVNTVALTWRFMKCWEGTTEITNYFSLLSLLLSTYKN